MALLMIAVQIPQMAFAADDSMSYNAELAFTDSAITETVAGSGYSIDGTALTISASGVYHITGSCSDGNIVVAAGLSGVVLVLDDLTLTADSTAPLVVKKNTTSTIHLEGESTLTDNEDPANEDSSDTTTAENFEGAAVKVKSGSTVTFCGSGTLTADGSSCKNAIKGASTASLIFSDSRTSYVIKAANNGIASDGSVVIYGGTFDIDTDNDGIKSTPDASDSEEGTEVDTESEGTVTIYGGTFDIDVSGDGIQADTNLSIYNGTFDIKTLNGYNTQGTKYYTNGNTSSSYAFDPDSMSCKGLKASGDRAEEVGTEPVLYVTGGSFTMDTADDAVHSDGYATVTGGTFSIYTGDDGMHADTSLTLGTDGSAVKRDPDVTVSACYEGLEGGTVYIYQGCYYIIAKDDGVNAAGDSGTGDNFNPGGGPGTPGQGGRGTGSGSSDYNIYINGGSLYVDSSGDGIDSNGGLYLTGGIQEVFGPSSGDNSAFDADGTVSIDGATVFTAGISGMDGSAQPGWFGSNQKYTTKSTTVSSGKIVNASLSGTVLYSTKLTKAASYFMYSAPDLSGTPTLSTAASLTSCKGGSWSHSWDSGVTTKEAAASSTGVITYTCSKCGATETQTIPAAAEYTCEDSHQASSSEEEGDEGYTVTFAGDSGVSSISVYYTQDYTEADETLPATGTAVSRNSDTGEADSSGSGQVNFMIVLADGYSISEVTAEGNYKNIKDPSDTGNANTYRITKITGDITVTITVEPETPTPDHTPGDINGDGKVNNRDLTRLAQYLAGKDVEYAPGSLDVNGDGKVNNRDLTRLAQYLAGKDVELY